MTAAATLPHPPTSVFPAVGPVTVTFSPKGEGEALVVDAIDGAVSSVRVQAYEFSSAAICGAVLRAHARGLLVMVILDKQNRYDPASKRMNVIGKSSRMPALLAAGIPVYLDQVSTIAHSKVVLVDEDLVVTGSFNFTSAAQKLNAENLLTIRDAAVAAAYLGNFNWRLASSKPA